MTPLSSLLLFMENKRKNKKIFCKFFRVFSSIFIILSHLSLIINLALEEKEC